MARKGAQGLHVPAKKSLGQHFLADRGYLDQIVAAAELAPTDLVLEIGPGKGVLTQALAAHARGVVSVELDDRLIVPLRSQFATRPQVRIVHGDILDLDPSALIDELIVELGAGRHQLSATGQGLATGAGPAPVAGPAVYKVVADLPYYITSAVLRQLLEARVSPSRIVVLVQWEVAQRVCAQPGDMSLLAVSVQAYAEPHLLQRVPAHAFRPIPKVDSAILRLDVRPEPAMSIAPEVFFAAVKAGFSQKRKQLLNSLSAGLLRPKSEILAALAGAHIEPTRRAETLTLAEWEELSRCLFGAGNREND